MFYGFSTNRIYVSCAGGERAMQCAVPSALRIPYAAGKFEKRAEGEQAGPDTPLAKLVCS
jgi:hypothetical protein